MRIQKKTILILTIFIFITVLLVIFELRPYFPDPDSFYHAKMATVIRDQSFIKTFPWLSETVFNENYINHHLLYHIFLIPFVTFFDPLVGIKISAVVFGILAFFALYKVLQALKSPFPEWLTLAAALSTSFIFRMSLPRAPSISLFFLLIGVWALLERKRWLIFFSSAAFVWLYNGWPLLLPVWAAILFGRTIGEYGLSKKTFLKSFFSTLRDETRIGLILLAGLSWGLVTHPYFPENIIFSFLHILKIGFLNATNDIPVGSEWYPASLSDFIKYNLPAVAALIFGFLTFFLAIVLEKAEKTKKIFEQSIIMVTLAGAFVLMTMKSMRYYEYSIPFVVLAAGSLLSISRPFIQNELIPMFKEQFKKRYFKISAIIILFVTIFGFAFGNYQNTKSGDGYFRAEQYQEGVNWIKNNVPANETVFHNIWDYSMILWYLDSDHRYLVGLDPMFMYDKNPDRFRLWQGLASGTNTDVSKITSEFGARVIVIDKRAKSNEDLMNNLRNSNLFNEVYSNEWINIFASLELSL